MGDNLIDFRRVHRRPTPKRRMRLDGFLAAEAAHVDADPVVRASTTAPTTELLHVQRLELACEAAALKFNRIYGAHNPKEIGRLISRRIRALRAVATATLEIHGLEAGSPPPVVLRRVCDQLKTEVMTAAEGVLGRDAADRLGAALQGRWDAALDRVIDSGGTAFPEA